MQYLKVWMGVVTGSTAGRDDGYPEEKLQLVNSVEDLVRTYSPRATYYRLEKVKVDDVVRAVKDLGK